MKTVVMSWSELGALRMACAYGATALSREASECVTDSYKQTLLREATRLSRLADILHSIDIKLCYGPVAIVNEAADTPDTREKEGEAA